MIVSKAITVTANGCRSIVKLLNVPGGFAACATLNAQDGKVVPFAFEGAGGAETPASARLFRIFQLLGDFLNNQIAKFPAREARDN